MPNVIIDMDSGLQRVGGNAALFKRLLGKYADGGYLMKLEDHISSGQLSDAAVDAHTIKGVSANLSLIRVNAAALALELALKNGEDYSQKLSALRDAHNEAIAEISKL